MTRDEDRDVRLVKAARELMRWDQARLAEEAGLSLASVRRYETGRGDIAASIEEDVIGALERAGIVFMGRERVGATDCAGGVLVRTSARPDPPAQKRTYNYPDRAPGRPVGRREAKPRKPRARDDDHEQ